VWVVCVLAAKEIIGAKRSTEQHDAESTNNMVVNNPSFTITRNFFCNQLTDEEVWVGVAFSFERLLFSMEDCVVSGNCYWEVLVPGCSVIVLSVVVVVLRSTRMKCARMPMSREDYCW
jgi:hypothetical protein